MNVFRMLPVLLLAGILSITTQGQTNKVMHDYLNIPGPIVLDKKSYNLSWSSHPSANFYKQEYIQKGDNPEKFKEMILVDVITGNPDSHRDAIKEVVAAKIAGLKKMKESNPAVNYETFDNSKAGEYMIDFLLTANAADGKMSIAERNIYRYKTFTDQSGKTGILLFGVSTRSYGANIPTFFASLKTNKSDLLNHVAQYKIPPVKI
jgi:hypothetical protein